MFDSVGKDQQFLIIGLIAVIILGSGVALYRRFWPQAESPAIQIEEPALSAAFPVSAAKASERIVHISGAVKKSGVYSLKQGDRIVDAIQAAGGALSGADLNALNLAAELVDGQKITIPLAVQNTSALNSPSLSSAAGKVSLNLASAEQLATVKGIGKSVAEKIIEFRNQNGPFQKLEDITRVPRIKKNKFEKIKEFITL